LVYNAWWFEAIMVFFVINFCGNIVRYRLYKKEKWSTLVIHLSFILILTGAFITRYIGYEGVLAIREGATENKMLSEKTYLTTLIDGDFEIDGVLQRRKNEKQLLLSERLGKRNHFSINTDYDKTPITIEYVNYIEVAAETVIADENGDTYLQMVESGEGSRRTHWLKEGTVT